MTLADAITALNADSARNTSVVNSALAYIRGVPALLAAAGVDPSVLDTVTAALKANDDAMVAALVANTPAAPATAPLPKGGAAASLPTPPDAGTPTT